MKIKIRYVCFVISIFINALLVEHIMNMEPACEHIHYDDIDREKDIIQDEETAARIAEAVLRMEKSMWGLSEDRTYYAEITYNDEEYEWIVHFDVNPPGEPIVWLDAERIVGVRRDSGMVLFYGRSLDNIGMYNDL